MHVPELPIHIVVDNPQNVGHDGKEMFLLCLAGLILCVLTGHDPGRLGFALMGGGVLFGLGLWTLRVARFRGRRIELLLDQEFLHLSRDLLKHPRLWAQFREGQFIRIRWAEIARWDFTDPDYSARGMEWYPTEYSLRIRSQPGSLLILYREPLLEVEYRFIPAVELMLKSRGHEFYGLPG